MSLLKRRYIVSGGISKSLNFWDPSQGRWLDGINRAQDGYVLCCTNFGSDILATGSDGDLVFWKWKQGKIWKEIHGGEFTNQSIISYPLSRRKPSVIFSGCSDCIIRTWKPDSNECVGKLIGHTSGVLKLSLHTDGKLISSSEDSTVRLWDVEKEQVVRTLRDNKIEGGRIFCADFDSNTKLCFSGTETGQVNIWDNENLVKQIKNIRSSVHSILCLPKHQFMFGDKAGRIFCYDQRKTETKLWKRKLHRNVVSDLVNLRDSTVASSSWDSSIRVLKIEDGKVVRKLKEKREIRCLSVLESSKKRKCPFSSASPQTLPFKRDLTRTRVQLSQAVLSLSSPRFILVDFLEEIRNIRKYIHTQTNKKVLDDHCYYLVDLITEEIENIRGKTYLLKEGRNITIYVGEWKNTSVKKRGNNNPNKTAKKRKPADRNSMNLPKNHKRLFLGNDFATPDDQLMIHRRRVRRRRSLSCGLPVETSMYSPMKTPKKISEFQVTGHGKMYSEEKGKGVFTLVYDGDIENNRRHGFGKCYEIFKKNASPVDTVMKNNSSSSVSKSPNSPVGKFVVNSPITSPLPSKKNKNTKKNKKEMKKKFELLSVVVRVKYMGMWYRDVRQGFGIIESSHGKQKMGIFQNGKLVEKLEELLTKTEKYNTELGREFQEFVKYKKMNKLYYCLKSLWDDSMKYIMKATPFFQKELAVALEKKKNSESCTSSCIPQDESKEEEEETEGEEEEEEEEEGEKSVYDLIKNSSSSSIFPIRTKRGLYKRIRRIGGKAKQLLKSYDKRMTLVNFGEFRFLGNWVNDTFEGEGSLYIRQVAKKKRLSLSNLMKKKYRLIYYGEFKNGKKDGIGRLYNEDGKTINFFGIFEKGKKHGQGIEYGLPSAVVGEDQREGKLGKDGSPPVKAAVSSASQKSKGGGKKGVTSNSFDEVIMREGEWERGRFIGRRQMVKVKEMDLSWFFKEILSDPSKATDHFIGQGTFAQVYRLYFSKYGWCAFKYFPHASQNPGQLSQIRSEMELMCQLDHVNIIKLFAFSMKEPVGLVQEFLDISLNTFIDRLSPKNKEKQKKPPISKQDLFRKKMKIILETSRGMEYLHSNHVMHRDLKWDNIMLDKGGTVKIIDFGFSKWIKSFLPQRNTYGKVGSPFYIAPEVLTGSTGGNYKYKCDVFSFGVMLYEIIFETLDPYDVANRDDYYGSIEWDVAKKGVRPNVPKEFLLENPELVWLINLMKRCWEGDAGKRPSFTEILQEIHCNTYFMWKKKD